MVPRKTFHDYTSDAEHTLFEHFDARTASILKELGIEAHYNPEALIFSEGSQCGLFFMIVSGQVALEMPRDIYGPRIQTLQPGDFLGWSALLGSGHRHFQARAMTRVTVLTFDGARLRKTCEDDPRFGYALFNRLLHVVTEALDAARMRITENVRVQAAGSY